MSRNENVELTVGLGRGSTGRIPPESCEQRLTEIMESVGVEFAFERREKNIAENEDDDAPAERIYIRECNSELSVMELLADHRLIIDAGSQPELYLQIAGLSACVPMLISEESQYVVHKGNGWILNGQEDMPQALDYFLNGLANWNRALVASLGKIGEYTNGSIAARWKAAMHRQEV